MTVGFELDGEFVGTIRAVPMRHGLTLAEDLLASAAPEGPHPYHGGWEIGRLVIDPSFRGGVDSLRRCLLLALGYLRHTVQAAHLYAACTPELARLYRRFGFGLLYADVPLRGTSKCYSLIHGNPKDIIAALGSGEQKPDSVAHRNAYRAAHISWKRHPEKTSS